MTPEQMLSLVAFLGAAVYAYSRFFSRIANKHREDVDDIDLSVARFKQSRTEKGLCIYCAAPVDAGAPRGASGHAICQKCLNEINPGAGA